MLKVYGVAGRARSGKDTISDYMLSILPDSIKLYHAYPLKKEALKYLSIDTIEELNYYKDNNIKCNGINIRRLLQELADTFRSENPLYYVEKMKESILNAYNNGYKNIVVSDIRYIKELDALKEYCGNGIISMRIVRNNVNIEESNHSSESEVDMIKTDYLIVNDTTIDRLKEKINKIIYKI